MRHRSIAIALGFVLLAVLLVAGIATILPSQSQVRADTVAAVAPAHPKPDRSKAIQQPPSKIGLGYITPPPIGKTLTDGQVTAAIERHKFIGGDTTTGALPKVVKVEHMTTLDVQKRRGVKPFVPDNEQLVFVTISGPFKLNHVHAPDKEAARLATQTANVAYLLIDIQTGNLQGWFL